MMGLSHSRLSGMDASAMDSCIGEADAAVTLGGVGLRVRSSKNSQPASANVGPPPGGEIGTVNDTLGLVVSTLHTYYL